MELIQLTSDYEIKPFDCGDAVLNGFLLNDAEFYHEKRLATTFLLCEGDEIVGYYSLFNDKISKQEVSKATWRKIKKLFPHSKHFGSYPAVKIGRFAISTLWQGKGIGHDLMSSLRVRLLLNGSDSSFRFLTVDAYPEAISFYERNGFRRLDPDEAPGDTRSMFFDMMQL